MAPIVVRSSEHPIARVTCYPTCAEVVREYAVVLPEAGKSVSVKITELPDTFLDDSLRVKAQGARMHDVHISHEDIKEPKHRESDRVVELKEHAARLNDEGATLEQSSAALERHLCTLSAKDDIKINEMVSALASYRVEKKFLAQDIRRVRTELTQVNEELYDLTKPRSDVTVTLVADEPGEKLLSLAYTVNGASWRAAYVVRATTDRPAVPSSSKAEDSGSSITLEYKAEIQQNSGESWNDVHITLQTVAPTLNLRRPTLRPWSLSLSPEQGFVPAQPQMASAAAATFGSSGFAQPTFGSPAAPATFGSAPAVMAKSALQDFAASAGFGAAASAPQGPVVDVQTNTMQANTTFNVPGKVTVPSDGSKHSLLVGEFNLDAEIDHEVFPRLEWRCHIQAKIINSTSMTLFAGPVSIYVDDTFVATTNIKTVTPAESFDLALGVDPSIDVNVLPVVRKDLKTSSFLAGKQAFLACLHRYKITNKKTVDVDGVLVYDNIPVAEDAAISVEVHEPTLIEGAAKESSTKPSGEEAPKPKADKHSVKRYNPSSAATKHGVWVDEKEGKFMLVLDKLAPGQEVEIIVHFEVSYPSTRALWGSKPLL